MLGYIRPYKPEMKLQEYELYRGVYCGLCKTLGEEFGPFSRMTLSYDFTFLALLDLSLKGACPGFARQRCAANPFLKKTCCTARDELKRTAQAAMIMVYHEAVDNLHDEDWKGKLLSGCSYPVLKSAALRAQKSQPEIAGAVALLMERQGELERNGCASTDEAAEPSALAMGNIAALLSSGPAQERILHQLGYYLGRWVYLVDALDDLEKDLAHRGYNPFVIKYGLGQTPREHLEKQLRFAREEARASIYMTIGEIQKAYELLDLSLFREILDNILYLGLKNVTDSVLSGSFHTRRDREE